MTGKIDKSGKIYPVEGETLNAMQIARTKHNYHEHPLFQLDALEALASRLMPLKKCRFIAPDTKVDSPFSHTSEPAEGRAISEVFRRIEEPGSWIALYDVQLDPIYRDLLTQVRKEIERLVHPMQKVHDVRAFIFISAPPSVTPFHIDGENNFWLQIKGHKKLTLWDHKDREVVSGPDVERFLIFGGLDGVKLEQSMIDRGQSFDCYPGDGVYFPLTTPHMTESHPKWMREDSVTISVGMVFYSNITRRYAWVNQMNYFLRNVGITPGQAGGSSIMDLAKAYTGRSLWELRKVLIKGEQLFKRR